MTLGTKRLILVDAIKKILNEFDMKMTVRQIYYQLVSKHIIPNTIQSYKSYNNTLTRAREENLINPNSILDTSKPILKQSSWGNLPDFLDVVRVSSKKVCFFFFFFWRE